ncbi:MAG: hypothetical protein II740_07595, partial [Lachnospiraceae bacterium]|nr:hypothetical protein [Lachnospiraceae bacterium]
WNFKLNGKVSSLEIEDVDGDNIPEIITACTTGDIQSAMYPCYKGLFPIVIFNFINLLLVKCLFLV